MVTGSIPEVLIIGAGAAGLAAARTLALEGVSVQILEARERIGGRILTLHASAAPLPVELGAEFILGRPRELLELLDADGLNYLEVSQEHWLAQAGSFRLLNDSQLSGVSETYRYRFSAANRLLRVQEGYDSLCEYLLRSTLNARLQLKCMVTEVRWRPGKVTVVTSNGTSERLFRARRLIVTLPLGVFKCQPGSEGAVRFTPPLLEKQLAASRLETGNVFKIIFRFQLPFWEDKLKLGFLHAPGEAVPLWWGTQPQSSGLLTGWAGGPAAAALLGRGREHAVEQALLSLSRIMALGVDLLGERLDCWYFHDWQNDPFSRGAYSYVKASALSEQKNLAIPIADTLFFAGEALSQRGVSGTVDGAMETGQRAADEILQRMHRGFGRAA